MAKAPTTKTTATSSTTPTAPAAGEGVTNPINAPVAPATAESGTVPTAPIKPTEDDSAVLKAQAESLDLWVHNKGVFSKTEPRSKVLLGAGKTTHIQISSVAMRQTVERNIEQMNHLNGGRLLVLVDQPVAPEPEEGS